MPEKCYYDWLAILRRNSEPWSRGRLLADSW